MGPIAGTRFSPSVRSASVRSALPGRDWLRWAVLFGAVFLAWPAHAMHLAEGILPLPFVAVALWLFRRRTVDDRYYKPFVGMIAAAVFLISCMPVPVPTAGTLERERRITVVLATHAIDLVPYLADRVLLLGEGRVLADGTPGTVFNRTMELSLARLRLPLVARLGLELRSGGLSIPHPLPLTVEEAKSQWTASLS